MITPIVLKTELDDFKARSFNKCANDLEHSVRTKYKALCGTKFHCIFHRVGSKCALNSLNAVKFVLSITNIIIFLFRFIDCRISETELLTLAEKTKRQLRLRELLLANSKDSKLVVMSLPMPRKVSADVICRPSTKGNI